MVTSPRLHGSPGACMKSPEQGSINGSPLSSYPSMYMRQRNTPNQANDTFEKPIRRLFQSDAEPTESSYQMKQPMELASAKKLLFRNYRDSVDDTMNDSIISNDGGRGALNYTFNDSIIVSPGYRERNLKCADADKGLEVIGRCLAKDQRIHWREFWPFLDNKLVDISSNDGLGAFEQYLQQRIKQQMKTTPLKALPLNLNNITMSTPVSKICEKLTKLQFARENNIDVAPISTTPPSPNAFHAYLCVEKSCQLYAKRLLKPIVQSPNNIVMINDSLVGELSRLRSLVSSYKEDIRFFGVDFRSAHARFAHIVVAVLRDMEDAAIDVFHDTVIRILATKEKVNSTPCKNGTNAENVKNTSQLVCLLRNLVKRLNDRNNLISPEILTKESECTELWHNEETCDCEWTNITAGKTSRSIRRKMENLLRLHTENDRPVKNGGVNGTNGSVTESCDDDESYLVSSLIRRFEDCMKLFLMKMAD